MSNFRRRLMSSLKKEDYLPSVYQKVDYIESSGTQYIDTKFTQNSPQAGYYIKYQNAGNHNGDDVVMGVLSPNRCIYINFLEAGASWRESGVGPDGGDRISALKTDIIETWLNFKNNNKRQISLNGNISVLEEILDVTTTNEKFCLVFGASYNYNNVYGRAKGVRVFSAKISYNNNIVMNLIPCYRKSDGEVGMYDTVEYKFYTNQGTGKFTYGYDK